MRLFKYFPPERINVLSSGRLCFSAPANLNDPFELKAPLQLFESDEHLSDQLKRMLPTVIEKALDEDFPPGIDRDLVRGLMESFVSDKLGGVIQIISAGAPLIGSNIHQKIGSLLGMLCLSESKGNLLMWAHYSASHTGFVLEFDTDHQFFNQRKSDKDELRHLRKVEYSQERPVFTANNQAGVSLLLTKSDHWRYEQEWRMVLPLADASLVIEVSGAQYHLFDFPRECIRSVVLGCRMADKHRTEMIETLRNVPELGRPECSKALVDQRFFRLNFEQVDY